LKDLTNSKINKIFLHGFRGSGKSSVAKSLSERIKWDFVEMDELIEQNANKSIGELTENGKNWLIMRQMESEVLDKVLDMQNVVISTGGGLCVNNLTGANNFKKVKDNEKVLNILLEAKDEIIAERIFDDEIRKSQEEPIRPVLSIEFSIKYEKATTVREKAEIIIEDSMQVLSSRRDLYKEIAPHIIDTTEMTIERIVDRILDIIKLTDND
jgi:shikimate kinase